MATRNLPHGTVTFLFTDVEGSTRLLHALGPERYADALAEHRRQLRAAFARHGGEEVDTQGDAFFVAFPTAPGALAAALEARDALSTGPIAVRMGIHTGTPHLTDEGYVGADVHRAARIAAAGHGGQILVSATTAALLDAVELRDLGLHRLKDLAAPERIFQADAGDHPPLKTLHQTNLPIPATPFLGRASDLADLVALLARGDVRLITLTGPGGTGKTRLALQAAADAADEFPGGAWWVPLAPLHDASLVLETAARAIGAQGDLAEHVGDQKVLLLFDNFEHLLGAADRLASLLAACRNLTVLVTSRERLHLAGEHEYGVDPLDGADAVELFLTRALAAKRDFAANGEVAQICERLDRLPLAIELAAARVKVLSPRALLERLDQRLPLLAGGARDVPERQRTLRATIEWSHELLTPAEQQLFGRLAVFRGGCTVEAAEAVVDADLDALASLVDKSLVRVRPDSGRFWMLETIREFAAERLAASGELDVLRQRHAEHFLALAEEAFPRLRGNPAEWLDRLERDHDNLRAALDHFEATSQTQRQLQLAGALWKFWNLRGHFHELSQRTARALAVDDSPTPARARALIGATAAASEAGSHEAAERWGSEARDLYRSLGDEEGVANATFLLGGAANEIGNHEAAVPLLEEALHIFDGLGDDHYAMLCLFHLGWAHGELGDTPLADALAEDGLRRARQAGNPRMEASFLESLSIHHLETGDADAALTLLRESFVIHLRVGETVRIPDSLSRIGRCLAELGRSELATQLIARSTALYEEGAGVPRYVRVRHDEVVPGLRVTLGDAAFDAAWAAGERMSTDDAVALALSG